MSTIVKRERRTYPGVMDFEVIHHSDARYTVQTFSYGNIVNYSYTIERPITLDEAEDFLRVVKRLRDASP